MEEEEEDSLTRLVGSRRGKLGACAWKMNEIKELFKTNGSPDNVKTLTDKF